MGVFDFLGFKAAHNDVTENDVQRALESQIMTGVGGSLITPEENFKSYIKHGYQANMVVNAAINYIIRRASDVPIVLVRKMPDGSKEEIFDHPALERLMQPNEIQDYKEFVQQVLGFKLLTGNSYVWKMLSSTRPNDPVPLKMYALPSQFMDIKTGGKMNEIIDKYVLNTIAKGSFEPEEILHWRSPNFDYENGQWLIGQSPLRAALQTLNVNNSNERAMAKQAQNQGALGLLMRDTNDKFPMSESQTRQVQNSLRKNVMGADNKGRIVATSQAYKWQQLGMTAADMQLIETSKITMRQLLAIYGLDSKLFNDPEAQTYNNMQEARKGAYTEGILPLMHDFASKLTQNMLKNERDLMFTLDTQNIEALKEDNSKLIATLSNADFIPTSKKQEMIGLEPDGVLPEYLVSPNKLPFDSISDPNNPELEED